MADYGLRPVTNAHIAPWARDVRTNPFGYSTQVQQIATAKPEYEQPAEYFVDPTFFQPTTVQTPQNVMGALHWSPHVGQDGPPGGNFADPVFSSSQKIAKPLPTSSSHMLKVFSNI